MDSEHSAGDREAVGVSADRPLRDSTAMALALADVLAVRPPQAQRMLGIGETTFWRLVKAGEIEVARYGPNLTIVPLDGLRRFIARHTVRRQTAEPIAD